MRIEGERCRTFQICAGAEGSTFTGDDGNAERGLVVEPVPQLVELFVAGCVDAIEGFWAGKDDEEDERRGEGDAGERGWRRRGFEGLRAHCYWPTSAKLVCEVWSDMVMAIIHAENNRRFIYLLYDIVDMLGEWFNCQSSLLSAEVDMLASSGLALLAALTHQSLICLGRNFPAVGKK